MASHLFSGCGLFGAPKRHASKEIRAMAEEEDHEHPLLHRERTGGSNVMGRFKQWSSILAQATNRPAFVEMHRTRVPILVDPRVFFPWAEAQPKPLRYKLMGVFRTFIMSETYSRAVITEGALYHDLEGNVTRPVPETSVESARKNLAKIEAQRAELLAAKPNEPEQKRKTLSLKAKKSARHADDWRPTEER